MTRPATHFSELVLRTPYLWLTARSYYFLLFHR
jgi:hypothetical protein